MLFDHVQLIEGTQIVNATVDSGTSFPANPTVGELFYKSDEPQLYVYDGTQWTEAGGTGNAIVAGTNTQVQFNDNGVLGASSNLTWTQGTTTLYINGALSMETGPVLSTYLSGGQYGGWIDMPTAGPSGIGSGGPGQNVWIGRAHQNAFWQTDSLTGDIVIRNTSGRILIGTAAAAASKLAILASGALAVGGTSNTGSSGQVLTSAGAGASPTWTTPTTATWGSIVGTLSNQTDLNSALSGKANTSHTHSTSDITSFNSAVPASTARSTAASAPPASMRWLTSSSPRLTPGR